MRGRYRTALALTGALGLITAGCGGGDDAAESATPADPAGTGSNEVDDHDPPLVVATTTIWADVASNVVCHNLVDVATVVPAGADAHYYEPSLQDRSLMAAADILIANGLFLEEALIGTIDAVAAEGVALFEVATYIADPIEFDDERGHDDDDHDDDDDDHDGDDPHVWFDPARVAAVLPMLGDAIVGATGIDAGAVAECVADYQAELMETDAAMTETFSVIDPEMRKLVSTHESLGYLADRYDFEIIGTVLEGTSSMAETNPADLEDLAREISATGVPAVFAEAEANQADLEAVASRADVEVVILPTEALGEPGSGFDTYISFLRSNAQLIADALG